MISTRAANKRHKKIHRLFGRKVRPLINKNTSNQSNDLEKVHYSNKASSSNNSKPTGNTNNKSFEFSTVDDMMITEVVLGYLQAELDRIKEEIAHFKSQCRLFSQDDSHFYSEKTKLISEYVKCRDVQEKMKLKEKLVRETLYSILT